MVQIISKRSGPRREDAQIKRVLQENRTTITKIADQISNGNYSASKQPKPKPQAQGLIIHVLGGNTETVPQPAIRISINGRVVVVDENTSRQLHHLGDIRSKNGSEAFVLATKANGYFVPLDDEYLQMLAELDGVLLHSVGGEDQLAAEIRSRLGIA